MTFTSLPAVATSAHRFWGAGVLAMFFSASSSRFGGSIDLRLSATWSCPSTSTVLIGEPEIGTPSTVMQVLKQRVADRLLPPLRRFQNQPSLWRENRKQKKRHFFQPRFYDFNVYTRKKMIEKLRYMHRNPEKRGLVPFPELWAWSSFRAYYFAEKSVVWIEGLNPNPKLRIVKPNRVGGD